MVNAKKEKREKNEKEGNIKLPGDDFIRATTVPFRRDNTKVIAAVCQRQRKKSTDIRKVKGLDMRTHIASLCNAPWSWVTFLANLWPLTSCSRN